VLTSCLLVFGRLSLDGELNAMRACGISMWRIMFGPLALAVLLAAVCVYVNADLAPHGRYARRLVRAEMAALAPIDLLEEGRFLKGFPNMTVYIGERQGTNLLDVRIIDSSRKSVKREIRAKRGSVHAERDDLVVDLEDVRIDPFLDDRPGAGYCDRMPIRMAGALSTRQPFALDKDLTTVQLRQRRADLPREQARLTAAERRVQDMRMAVEINQRLALSAACCAFAMLGMPLGVKTRRKESSIGVAISLLVVFAFYSFIIASRSLTRYPQWRPDLIVWLPVAIGILAGAVLVARSD
jgi:lipopolysaccharide export system permease protein